jgi:sec-independent protein translocase protein TatA
LTAYLYREPCLVLKTWQVYFGFNQILIRRKNMGFSIPHLLMVLAIAILVFGTRRLKNAGSDLGEAIKGFRNAVKDGEDSQQTLMQRDGGTREGGIVEPQKSKV